MATHLNSGTEPPRLNENDQQSVPQQLQQQPQTQPQLPQPEQQHHELQAQQILEQQIPIHIAHHEATQLEEPKYIELTTQQLAQHLPPHSTYNSPPGPPTTLPMTSVTYREFKFP